MSKRNLLLYIDDIFDSCNKIQKYTDGYTYTKFKKDIKTVDAVIRNLEIIGEASKMVPLKIRKKYKKVPWREMIDMRNKVSHEYFGVDCRILWATIETDIPDLLQSIIQIKKDVNMQSLF